MQQLGQLSVAALAIFITAYCLDHIGRAGRDVFLHTQRRIELEFLRQVAGPQRASHRDVAGIRHLLAGQNFQQRRLAAAVAPYHADFLAGGHRECHAVQQRLVTVGQANFVGGEQCGHERAACGLSRPKRPPPMMDSTRGADFFKNALDSRWLLRLIRIINPPTHDRLALGAFGIAPRTGWYSLSIGSTFSPAIPASRPPGPPP